MQANLGKTRTIHELLFFEWNGKVFAVALQEQREDVKARTPLMAFHRERAGVVLHREVIPHRS
jgi:hypothetical protein